jgi:hypothetical protein
MAPYLYSSDLTVEYTLATDRSSVVSRREENDQLYIALPSFTYLFEVE